MSLSHLLLIAIVALVLFGPNKLPELGRAIGRTMREFKKGAQDLMDDVQLSPQEERKDVTPKPVPDPVSGLQFPPVAPVQTSPNTQNAVTAEAAQANQAVQAADTASMSQSAQVAQQDETAQPEKAAPGDFQAVESQPSQMSPLTQPAQQSQPSPAQQAMHSQEAKPFRQEKPADSRRLPD
ncbi:MAG: tatA [Paenibacillus sp.]|jgi:sec-independent protein translocase protein TatA|nr:tatA [Paenibacillus sp.]